MEDSVTFIKRRALELSDNDWERLQRLAEILGASSDGRPNRTALLTAIAAGDIVCYWRDGVRRIGWDNASRRESVKGGVLDIGEIAPFGEGNPSECWFED